MKKSSNSPISNRGFSVVELMLASVLGLLLIGGIIDIFISNKATYRLQEGLARIQENGRILHRFLTADIRPSGFQGCANMKNQTPNILVNPPGANLNFATNTIVSGHNYNTESDTWEPALPTWLTSSLTTGTSIQPGTDVIIIRRGAGDSAQLLSVMNTTANNLVIPGDRMQIATGDILIVSDCEQADVFQATSVTGGGATNYTIGHSNANNTTNNLSKLYQTDAIVTRVELSAFYVKDSGRNNRAGNDILSLYRQDISGTERELIEGLEDFQLSYGVDTTGDGNADTYRTASEVQTNNQWESVKGINTSALINSIEDVNEVATPYTFNGTTVAAPADRLSRRQWNVFISLRNRN